MADQNIKRLKKALVSALLLTTVFGASRLMAATDGTLGNTSTGTAVITLTIPQLYRISGVADLALGSYAGSGTMTGNDDVCVYSNGVTTYGISGANHLCHHLETVPECCWHGKCVWSYFQ